MPRGESGMIRSRDRRPPIRAISSTNGVKRQRQIAEASSSIRARTVIGRLSLLLRSHYAASFRPITPKRPAQPRVTRGKNWSLLEQLGGKNKVERGRRWKNSTRSSMEQNVNAIFHRGSETVARRRETTGWLARRIDFPTYHATRYPPYSFRCFRHVWSLFFLFFFPLLFLLSAFEEPLCKYIEPLCKRIGLLVLVTLMRQVECPWLFILERMARQVARNGQHRGARKISAINRECDRTRGSYFSFVVVDSFDSIVVIDKFGIWEV